MGDFIAYSDGRLERDRPKANAEPGDGAFALSSALAAELNKQEGGSAWSWTVDQRDGKPTPTLTTVRNPDGRAFSITENPYHARGRIVVSGDLPPGQWYRSRDDNRKRDATVALERVLRGTYQARLCAHEVVRRIREDYTAIWKEAIGRADEALKAKQRQHALYLAVSDAFDTPAREEQHHRDAPTVYPRADWCYKAEVQYDGQTVRLELSNVTLPKLRGIIAVMEGETDGEG